MSSKIIENVLFKNRKGLTPQESMSKIVNYALVMDAKTTLNKNINRKARLTLIGLIIAYPIYYVLNGLTVGCWREIHPYDTITTSIVQTCRSYREVYRPEIFYKDQHRLLYEVDQKNKQLEKRGLIYGAGSPIVLWH